MGHPGTYDEPTDREAGELAHHPTPRAYVKVAAVLAIVTALEVAIYYVTAVGDLLVPMLIGFAFIKFFLVVSWFMHLKFDSHLFRRLFVAGLVLAMLVFGFVLWNFFARGGPAPSLPG